MGIDVGAKTVNANRVIHRHRLDLRKLTNELELQRDATLLHLADHGSNCLALWVLVDPDAELQSVRFHTLLTGQFVPAAVLKHSEFVGTVVIRGGIIAGDVVTHTFRESGEAK